MRAVVAHGAAAGIQERAKGRTLAVVSNRYKLVTHQELLNAVNAATTSLDVGPIPRGIYVDRGGARMRALFKFPALSRPVSVTGEICP